MAGTVPIVSGLAEAAGRIGGAASHLIQDRLDMAALELREAKIRIVQSVVAAAMALIFTLFGLLLLILAGVYALPPPWRVYGFAGAAAACLIAAAVAFAVLRRRLARQAMAFDQSLAELKKDLACFSTKS